MCQVLYCENRDSAGKTTELWTSSGKQFECDSLIKPGLRATASSASATRLCTLCELARRLRLTMVMSIQTSSIPKCLLWMFMASVMITAPGCNRYPASPREVVVSFVKATQSEDSDAKSYLSKVFQSSYSGKGFKYTFGEAQVLQSVPQTNGEYAVLVKSVRLAGGGVVTASDMRANVTKEGNHWVIAGLVAGLTNPGGHANNSWVTAEGIPIH